MIKFKPGKETNTEFLVRFETLTKWISNWNFALFKWVQQGLIISNLP